MTSRNLTYITICLNIMFAQTCAFLQYSLQPTTRRSILLALSGETSGLFEEEPSYQRFLGVGRLYEKESIVSADSISNKLSQSTVAVVGIGGVGSWAVEALVRSGVGNVILVDLDDICTSNINRQLHALSSTVGKIKIDVMKERVLDINPSCNVTLVHDFISVDNAIDIVASFKSKKVDIIIDSIDGQNEKTALIAAACIHQMPIITCGGAAGRFNPTEIVCDDLSRSEQCRLLASCKNRLRDTYKLFKQGSLKKTPRRWKIWAVFSTEVQKQVNPSADKSSFRRCDGALGTACFVTGTYGFVAASKAVSMIANDELIVPKIPKSMIKGNDFNK